MKAIERLELIVRSHGDYKPGDRDDIDAYLSSCAHGRRPSAVRTTGSGSTPKNFLAMRQANRRSRIAESLEFRITYTVISAGAVTESKFLRSRITSKLFISHVSSFRANNANSESLSGSARSQVLLPKRT